jgi:hemoglobin
MRKLSLLVVASVLALSPLAGCAPVQKAQVGPAPASAPKVVVRQEEFLFNRLGGMDGIKAVVDDFVARVAADKRINRFFNQAAADPNEMADFKRKLSEQICQATGGPCTYSGKDMRSAHQGMGITSGDFDALVEDLATSLDYLKVKQKERNELLGLLAPMKDEIVEAH